MDPSGYIGPMAMTSRGEEKEEEMEAKIQIVSNIPYVMMIRPNKQLNL